MANKQFKTRQELESYREDSFIINLTEVPSICPTLASMIKPKVPGVFRSGKFKPMITEGDTVIIIKDGQLLTKAFEKENNQVNEIITFEEIMASDYEVVSNGRTIIPPMKARYRKDLFTKYGYISDDLITVVSAALTNIIADQLGKEMVVDPNYAMKSSLVNGEMTFDEYKALALNYLYNKQFKTEDRFVIDEELILSTIETFKEELQSVIDMITAEVYSAMSDAFSTFINDRPCSRYHFDVSGTCFIVERGMDFRIYKSESERFDKEEENEEDSVLFKTSANSSKLSAKVDFF